MNVRPVALLLTCGLAAPACAETLTLKISTDAACIVLLDEQPVGQVEPGTPFTLETTAGDHSVGCLSRDYPGAMATATRLGSGTQSINFAPAATWARFTSDGSGWLADADTGLRWHLQGSADELTWTAAGEWCRSLGGRLPTREELQRLHVHGRDRSPCGDGLFCGIPHQLTLASRFVWTGDEFEGGQAIISGLAGQKPSAQSVPKEQTGLRALCVAP